MYRYLNVSRIQSLDHIAQTERSLTRQNNSLKKRERQQTSSVLTTREQAITTNLSYPQSLEDFPRGSPPNSSTQLSPPQSYK